MSRGPISVSTFALLFSEMISYYQARITSLSDLETKLDNAGYGIGQRVLETVAFREKPGRRETSVVSMLQFVSGVLWPALFGKQADALEKSTEHAHAYMIREDEPVTNYFISMPKEMSRLNVAAFIGGIVRGVLDSAGFTCTVQAIAVPPAAAADGPRDKTVFLIKFDESVAAREAST